MKKIFEWVTGSIMHKIIFGCIAAAAVSTAVCVPLYHVGILFNTHEHTEDFKYISNDDKTHQKISYCTDKDGKKCKDFKSKKVEEDCEFDENNICIYCGYQGIHEHTVDYTYESDNLGKHTQKSYCTEADGLHCDGFESEEVIEDCELNKDNICEKCHFLFNEEVEKEIKEKKAQAEENKKRVDFQVQEILNKNNIDTSSSNQQQQHYNDQQQTANQNNGSGLTAQEEMQQGIEEAIAQLEAEADIIAEDLKRQAQEWLDSPEGQPYKDVALITPPMRRIGTAGTYVDVNIINQKTLEVIKKFEYNNRVEGY